MRRHSGATHVATLTSSCRCVNFSDPFGLQGCKNDDYVCQIHRVGDQILGGLTGLTLGAGAGFGISLACAEVCSPAVVPAAALDGAIIGVAAAGRAFDNAHGDNAFASDNAGGGSSGEPQYKVPRSGVSGAEGAKDVPSWARGERPLVDEKGRDFAKRLLDQKYGEGNWGRGPGSEFSKIQKWGDRAFVNPPQ